MQDRVRRRLAIEPLELDDGDLERTERLANEGQGVVVEPVEALPDGERDAVKARVVEERSYGEIAATLHCSEMVVRKRVSRGLARVRRDLVCPCISAGCGGWRRGDIHRPAPVGAAGPAPPAATATRDRPQLPEPGPPSARRRVLLRHRPAATAGRPTGLDSLRLLHHPRERTAESGARFRAAGNRDDQRRRTGRPGVFARCLGPAAQPPGWRLRGLAPAGGPERSGHLRPGPRCASQAHRDRHPSRRRYRPPARPGGRYPRSRSGRQQAVICSSSLGRPIHQAPPSGGSARRMALVLTQPSSDKRVQVRALLRRRRPR